MTSLRCFFRGKPCHTKSVSPRNSPSPLTNTILTTAVLAATSSLSSYYLRSKTLMPRLRQLRKIGVGLSGATRARLTAPLRYVAKTSRQVTTLSIFMPHNTNPMAAVYPQNRRSGLIGHTAYAGDKHAGLNVRPPPSLPLRQPAIVLSLIQIFDGWMR